MAMFTSLIKTVFLLVVLIPVAAWSGDDGVRRMNPGGAGFYSWRVVRFFPHDRTAWTQGLVYDRGHLYEGTGLYGQSTLRKVKLNSGEVVKKNKLLPIFFGEGVAVSGDRIFQLTWQSRTGFVYKKGTFELLDTFGYDHEGWGATVLHEELAISDGTALLHFRNISSLQEKRTVRVFDGRHPVTGLNELECVRGDIYANVWPTNYIAVINPASGSVKGWLDMNGLLTADESRGVDALNGIAWDEKQNRLFVTGKLWPKIFEIEVIEK
jgi:glutamine cyclotransferase